MSNQRKKTGFWLVGVVVLAMLLLADCAGPSPEEAGADATPTPTAVVKAPSPTATQLSPTPAEGESMSAQGEIPFGVYAMMDWGRASGAEEGKANPWVKAGHYAFTWRQVNPERGVFDWDLVDRWLATEAGPLDAPTGKQVGLGVNAYEGGSGDAMPAWVADDYALNGYMDERMVIIAASEQEQLESHPELVLEIQQPGADQTQMIRFQHGLDGFTQSADTWIGAADPNASHAAESILVLGVAGQSNLLLGFHPDGLSQPAQVVSAKLRLHVLELTGEAGGTPLPIEVYALRRSWLPAGATWLSPQPGESWTIRGANGVLAEPDRDEESVGSAEISAPGVVETSLDPALIQGWLDDPGANLGLLIKQRPAGTILPRYWDENYLAALAEMVHALSERYANDPRVAWVEISVGIYGETSPANKPTLKWAFAEAGLTSDIHAPERGLYSWVNTAIRIIDIYRDAFPEKPLFLQYSNSFESVSERAAYVPYAVEKGIGLKHNGLYPDSIDGATYGGPAVGTFNIMSTYSETVPVGWEFQVFPRTEGNVYWAMLNALDKHADFVMVQKDAITRTELIPIFEFANQYLGHTLETTPAAWVALRETTRPAERWNTQHGNFNFYLQQSDIAPNGKTIPMWSVTDAKEGLFSRRTDQSTGNRYIYFDIDDSYFQGGHPVSLEVVYLDQGHDQWHIEYDAGNAGVKTLNSVEKEDTGQWQSIQYTLIDAVMNGGIEGYDFRIDCEQDGDEMIHLVRVSVLDG